MFRAEFIRALRNRSFLLGLFLAFLALGQGITDYVEGTTDPEYLKLLPINFNNAYDAVIWAQQGGIIGLVAPLIAVLPFSDSLSLDRVSGYLRFIMARTSYKKYFAAKVSASIVAGGLVLALPMMFFLISTTSFFPGGLI
jgi:hypothetical protein